MSNQDPVRVARDELERFVAAFLRRVGSPPDSASTVAVSIVAADARGYPSHGVALLPYYRRLVARGLDPAGVPTLVHESGAIATIDGGNGFGHLAAHAGIEAAISRARTFGIGAAAVGRSNHCGAMAVYSAAALDEQMIGIAMSNAMPTMAPWGGRERLLGMNPISISIPAVRETPVTVDVGFAVAARGKIVLRAQRGEPLPDGWAFDASGQPTTDAKEALEGLLAPIGDHKGSGLALVTGLLSTALAGAAFGSRLGSLESGPHAGADGHLMIALDVGSFIEFEVFGERVDGVLAELRASAPASPDGVVRLPGAGAAAIEEIANRDGVELSRGVLESLVDLSAELELPPPVTLASGKGA